VLVLKTVRDAEALNSCVKTILKLRTFRIFYIMSRWLHYGKLSFKLLDMLTNKRYYIIRCKSKNSFTPVIRARRFNELKLYERKVGQVFNMCKLFLNM